MAYTDNMKIHSVKRLLCVSTDCNQELGLNHCDERGKESRYSSAFGRCVTAIGEWVVRVVRMEWKDIP